MIVFSIPKITKNKDWDTHQVINIHQKTLFFPLKLCFYFVIVKPLWYSLYFNDPFSFLYFLSIIRMAEKSFSLLPSRLHTELIMQVLLMQKNLTKIKVGTHSFSNSYFCWCSGLSTAGVITEKNYRQNPNKKPPFILLDSRKFSSDSKRSARCEYSWAYYCVQ